MKTAKQWWAERRPEIVELFDREIYGRVPSNTPRVNWEVLSTTKEMNGHVPVITKKLVGHVANSSYPAVTVDIQLTLSMPANATDSVPVMMEFGLSPEVLEQLKKRFSDFFKQQPGPTWEQQVLAKGWGYAEYIPTSVQAQWRGADARHDRVGQQRPAAKVGRLGRVAGMGMGSEPLDYFETGQAVDAKRVGVEGHSRYDKPR